MDRDPDLLDGIEHVRNGRDAAALEAFALAADAAADAADRRSAVAFAAQTSLRLDRPYEAIGWVDRLRLESPASDEADLLEAAASVRLGDGEQALALLAGLVDPSTEDTVYPAALLQQLRCQAYGLVGRVDDALSEAFSALLGDWALPDIWRSMAAIASTSDVDVTDIIGCIPEEELLQVLGWLLDAPAVGADRIVEAIWCRYPGDRRVLALVSSLGSQLPLDRAVEWSTRLRAAGLGRDCAVLGLAASDDRPAVERVRACVIAGSAFHDERATALLELATAALEDNELAPALTGLLGSAPDDLVDAFIVAAATTPKRSLLVGRELLDRGAVDASVALVKHAVEQANATAVDVRAAATEAFSGADRKRIVAELRRRGAEAAAAAMVP